MRFTDKEEAREWQHGVTSRVGDIIKNRMKQAGISVKQMAKDLYSGWRVTEPTAAGKISNYRHGYAMDRIGEESDRIADEIESNGIATNVTAYQPKDRTKVRDIFRYIHAKESSLTESTKV